MVHLCHPSTRVVKAGGLRFPHQHEQNNEFSASLSYTATVVTIRIVIFITTICSHILYFLISLLRSHFTLTLLMP